jgi:nitroimidazol reductase NimA-like FMN-containing flavoprotein (pyridoxamine 5'-phosphate oxidase superfamily)
VILAEAEFEKGDLPCDDGYAYRSVLTEGLATLLTDNADRRRALRAIVNKYDPEAADRPFDEDVLAQTLVYAIVVDTVSFKQKPRPA